MNGVIFVMSDTLRADHVGCYGADHVHTPNLDEFAADATRFDANYAASYPTIPNRLDIWTGRYNFPHRGWTPLEADETTLPGQLTDHGVTTELVYDTPFLGTYDFDREFSGWRRIRGHHSDRMRTDPDLPEELPAEPYKLKQVAKTEQYLRNRAGWDLEREFIAPRTFTTAVEWLERNHDHDQFCLMVDAWEPHEIFDAPQQYIDMYDDYDGDAAIYPVYGRPDYLSEREHDHVRARYAAKITMIDRWFGELLGAIDRLGLSREVTVVFTSDHGHLFGEHGLQGKPTGSLGRLYPESTWTPLLVRHPEYGRGESVDQLTQPPDVMPTILDCLGVPVPGTVEGRSLLPLVTGEDDGDHREYAITARYPEGPEGQAAVFDGWAGPVDVLSPVTITDGRWYHVCHPDPDESELYDLEAPDDSPEDVIEDHEGVASEFRDVYIEFMREHDGERRLIEPFEAESHTTDTLDADEQLFVFEDAGTSFAHLSEDVAARRAPHGTDEPAIERTIFETLVERAPTTLVYINQQYYRAEDLALD